MTSATTSPLQVVAVNTLNFLSGSITSFHQFGELTHAHHQNEFKSGAEDSKNCDTAEKWAIRCETVHADRGYRKRDKCTIIMQIILWKEKFTYRLRKEFW